MPAAWSSKRERQYAAILASCSRSGRRASTCKRIAAATVNKTRSRMGETKEAKMAKRKKRSVRGLGAGDYAHETMASQKLADVDSALELSRGRGCAAKLTIYQRALADWGAAEAHVRSGVSAERVSGLRVRLEAARKRLVRLDGELRNCLCERG